jgi:magnesium-protoporphyrin O-methyltransferase
VDLSPAYDLEATRLATENGVADRIRRVNGDFAANPELAEPADLVVLHRVVCCYPDHERLLGAAADRCRGRLAFSHPPRNLIIRGIVAIQNAMFALGRRSFRTFAHSPESMVEVLTGHGLRAELHHRGRIWQAEGLTR